MTGTHLRKKIRAKGFTFQQIADAIGESKQNFSRILSTDNIKTETLERIAAAMGESVSYFYNEQPIFTLMEYTEYESRKRENELLRQIIRDKEALIEELRRNK
jgi:transcriptional regulator with XRE-family HTH domain